MRIIMHVEIPNGQFNAAVREGTAGEKLGRILEETKPEAVYFTEFDGKRGAIVVVDVPKDSSVPALAEPWFLSFDAAVKLRVAMTPEDLQAAGLEEIAKKYS